MPDNFERIAYFLQVCECGTVSKAAEELYISPQALNKQLRTLEDELGEKLSAKMKENINRSRQRVALAASRLKGLSPMERLEGGYSVASLADGRIVKKISQVKAGEELFVDVTDGRIVAQVQNVRKRVDLGGTAG